MAISAEVQLSVYNEALRILGERRLASVTESREPRRVLDDAWGDAVEYCLGKADWSFASRTSLLSYAPDVSPAFGWRYAFEKPADVVRLTAMAADEYMQMPLPAGQYSEEAGFWLSDYPELYARWVSDGEAYGNNGGLWPVPFRKYLAAYLADECCERITNATTKADRAQKGMRDALADARSQNALDQGVKFLPASSWVRSRNSIEGRNRR